VSSYRPAGAVSNYLHGLKPGRAVAVDSITARAESDCGVSACNSDMMYHFQALLSISICDAKTRRHRAVQAHRGQREAALRAPRYRRLRILLRGRGRGRAFHDRRPSQHRHHVRGRRRHRSHGGAAQLEDTSRGTHYPATQHKHIFWDTVGRNGSGSADKWNRVSPD